MRKKPAVQLRSKKIVARIVGHVGTFLLKMLHTLHTKKVEAGCWVDPSIQGTCEGSPGNQPQPRREEEMEVSSIKHQAPSNKHQATSVKRQAPSAASFRRQASSPEQQASSDKPQAASSTISLPS
jgi:hypothetical protein